MQILYKHEIEKIEKLCCDGMCTDGGHHKQWYLEQIFKLVAKPETLNSLRESGFEWEGIAP